MIYRNLTPHSVTIKNGAGHHVTILAEETSARVAMESRALAALSLGGDLVPLVRETLGMVEDLPEEQEGVSLIVSRMVCEAAPWRADLLYPAQVQRNEKGLPTVALALGSCYQGTR